MSTSADKFSNLLVAPCFDDEMLADLPDQARKWISQMLDYTVMGGKMNRAKSVLDTFQKLKPDAAEQEIDAAVACGWAIEYLQAFFLVADDYMDKSPIRRGQPCWYKLPRVGVISINDSFILESAVFLILKKFFGDKPFYLELVELFRKVIYYTELGQLLDLTSMQPDMEGPLGASGKYVPDTTPTSSEPLETKSTSESLQHSFDFLHFTLERYCKIVKYKTAFYSFVLPVHAGMLLAGYNYDDHADLFKSAENVLLQMGEYFQIQDDYLDCYGTPEQIGKVGTDIQDAKCGWLVVQALKIVNDDQMATLKAHYGVDSEESIAIIKGLYKTLNLADVYAKYEESAHKQLTSSIDELKKSATSGNVPVALTMFLNKIFKRTK